MDRLLLKRSKRWTLHTLMLYLMSINISLILQLYQKIQSVIELYPITGQKNCHKQAYIQARYSLTILEVIWKYQLSAITYLGHKGDPVIFQIDHI